MKSITNTFIKEVFTWKYLLLSTLIAFIYISFTVDLLNYRFALGTFFGNYSLPFKATVFLTLLEGIFTAFSKFDTSLLIITGLLIGINISLLVITARRLQGSNVKLLIGGGSILGLASTGCASCGFSVLSVLGIGTGFINFLPFGNKTLYIFSIGTLLFSIFYMTKKLNDANICKIEGR